MWFDNIYDGRPVYSSLFHSIARAINGMYVDSGCDLTMSGLTATIGTGKVYYNGSPYDVAETQLSIASATDDKAILIVWDYNSGSPLVTKIESSNVFSYGGRTFVKAPIPSDTQIPLYLLIYRANATTIAESDIYDIRLGSEATGISGNADLIPAIDDNFDIGNASLRWRNGYFAESVFAKDFVEQGYNVNSLYMGENWKVFTDSSGNVVVIKKGTGVVYSGDFGGAMSYVTTNCVDGDIIKVYGDYTVSATITFKDKKYLKIYFYGTLTADSALVDYMIDISSSQDWYNNQYNYLFVNRLVGNDQCSGILIHDGYKNEVEFNSIERMVKGISVTAVTNWTEGTKIRGGEISGTEHCIGFYVDGSDWNSFVNSTVMDVNMAITKYGVYVGANANLTSSVLINVGGGILANDAHTFHILGNVRGTVIVSPKSEDLNNQYTGDVLIYMDGDGELWVINPMGVNLDHIVYSPNGKQVSVLQDYRILFTGHSPGLYGGIGSVTDDMFVGWRLNGDQRRVLNVFDPTRTQDILWSWQDTTNWNTVFMLKKDGSIDMDGYIKTAGGIIGNNSGSGKLKFLNTADDNSLYLELFSNDESTSGTALYITGRYNTNMPDLYLKANTTHINGDVDITGKYMISGNPIKLDDLDDVSLGALQDGMVLKVFDVNGDGSVFTWEAAVPSVDWQNVLNKPPLTQAMAGALHIWVQDTEPTAIALGDLWFDTGNKVIKYYDGSAWTAFGAVFL